ncbi:Ca2+-transporting ATPase [Aequitasia blattaphilus]|uniref:Cation-translocating P-type ATPase n=1 Tax=Aequitasia blattaphilus TaxID=2949332 RepID=A0ABT1EC16_9FIRM|nr:cation-translocating P-type ATPase [Aequitasia blattaphilus]MCP1103362.1 cation-translocating P-type ATPase [Aequitasia blattaphilus]MCR8616002.1 cation-translocating P-type ATPase [Aequitasia blattaphilus]
MLSNEQAKINQEKYGYNELVEGKKKSLIQIFLEQYKDFLVIILIVAAIASGFLGDIESAIVIFVVITINAILGTVQTLKAEQSLNSLKQLSAPEAKVVRDGVLLQIPAREVTVGDHVVLEAGDSVPADGNIIECASLKVDESALTGESLAVEKSLDEVEPGAALGDQTNRVFSSSFVTYGRAAYKVTEIGMETEVGKIAKLIHSAEEKRTPLQVNLDDFGKKLSIIILIFCGILLGVSVFKGEGIIDAFLFAVALAVAAIPEALSSIVTIVLSFGTQKMAKENAIIRKLQAVEGLGSVSIVCSDKTGTLTQNKMTVEDYYVDEKRIRVDQINIAKDSEKFLMHCSMLCNDSTNVNGQEIGDPTETALINLGSNFGIEAMDLRAKYSRKAEIPFDSDRKLMATAHYLRHGYAMVVKGAVDVILKRVTKIRIDGVEREITKEDIVNIENQNMEFSRDGLRVLGFAYKDLPEERDITFEDEYDLIFLGLISMMDPPRVESKQAVTECIEAGIKPIMITGDHKITAAAIAKRIGILKDDSEAVEGAVIENMSDEELQDYVPKVSVYARVSPEHKIRIVKAWQDRGNIVAMTGDGVNDAPALKQADIGVAMGITGTEVSKDAASMVLTDDNFATIIKAVKNGRNVYQNIKNAIQFLLSGNFGGILSVLYASIAGLPVPFAPVHLLFINLLTDSLPAIALGLEPHSDDVMKEKPRKKNESILTRSFLLNIGLEGFVIGLMTMLAFTIGYKSGGTLLAQTMAFGTLCTGRLFHGFNCKANKPTIFTKRFFNNIYLVGAFLLGLALIVSVLVIPGLHTVFKVQSLNLTQLFIVIGLSFLNLPIIQLLKRIRHGRS